jgi:Pyridoxamine 5'-phosphate oxidase
VARWIDVEAAAPELAARAKELFLAQKHLTIATLRRDGGPRISGIECMFIDGDLWFGSMKGAVKALDLQRDPRFALHSGTGDSSQWEGNSAAWHGDAKLSGRVEELGPGERRAAAFAAAGHPDSGESHLFRAEIEEVATVRLGGDPPDHLLIDSWREGQEPRQIKR